MLLNYDIDTKDESLNPTAIELRRRIAGRKLKHAIDAKIVDEDTLIAMKESNRSEMDEHAHDQLSVTMAEVSQRVAMGRLDQQMNIHKSLGNLMFYCYYLNHTLIL